MADSIIQVKDVNGKQFDVNVSKICDINGDSDGSSGIKDSVMRNRINFQHDLEVVDSKGQAHSQSRLSRFGSGMMNAGSNAMSSAVQTIAPTRTMYRRR